MERYLRHKVRAIEVRSKSISELLREMRGTAYQGRSLAEAVEVWEAMLRDPDLTIVLGLAGSMATAGQWRLINWLLEQRCADVLVATGANVSEDIVDAMGLGYWQAEAGRDDASLLAADLNRYYDVYGREADYRKMEEEIADFLLNLPATRVYSSMELLHLFGRWLNVKGIESIAAVAARHGVPVFCPALVDSAYGEAFLMAKNRGHRLTVDQVRDFEQFVTLGERLKAFGVIYIGGGVPKDFAQLLAISISPQTMDRGVPGRQGIRRTHAQGVCYPHKYAIQITTDAPQWGGLSGCTLEEAISWGKVLSSGRHITCYCDATIALPLIAHALSERTTGKRNGPDLDWLFSQLP